MGADDIWSFAFVILVANLVMEGLAPVLNSCSILSFLL